VPHEPAPTLTFLDSATWAAALAHGEAETHPDLGPTA